MVLPKVRGTYGRQKGVLVYISGIGSDRCYKRTGYDRQEMLSQIVTSWLETSANYKRLGQNTRRSLNAFDVFVVGY